VAKTADWKPATDSSADGSVDPAVPIERYIPRTVSPDRRTLLRIQTGQLADLHVFTSSQLRGHLY
jgi:hypothetical protein